MGDGGALNPVSRLMSHALLYLVGDRTNTLGGAASCRTWPGRSRAGGEWNRTKLRLKIVALHVIVWI